MNATVVKFGTHHFPVGTIFRTMEDTRLGARSMKEYEVKAVIRNDIRSFVLETTTFDADLGMNVGLNISCVDKIIKRGSGPTVVYDSGFEKDFVCDRVSYIQNRLEIDKHFAISSGINVRKNEFILSTFDLPGLVWLFSEERVEYSIDQRRILECVEKSSLFRKGQNNYGEAYYIIKKDKFKKWVKQNINRFYMSLDKLEKELDMIDQTMLDQELDMDDVISSYSGPSYIQNNNQNRIDDLVEKAWADEAFKELDETLASIDEVLSQPQPNLDAAWKNHPVEKKHEEDF